MNGETQNSADREIFSGKNLRRAAIGCILLAGAAFRLYTADDRIPEHHVGRQLRSALIARSLFELERPGTHEAQKQIAWQNLANEETLELPFTEHIVKTVYHAAGFESLKAGRLVCGLIWMIGGFFFYRFAKKILMSPAGRIEAYDAPVIALGFYLLFPYGVSLSTNFQPESLMMTALSASLWAGIRYDRKRSAAAFLAWCLISFLAVLVKPIALCVLGPAAWAILRDSGRAEKVWLRRETLGYVLLALAPGALLYMQLLRGNSQITPQIYFRLEDYGSAQWRQWTWSMMGTVCGNTAFGLGLAGIFLFRNRLGRVMAAALWAGYAASVIFFNRAAASHDHYHVFAILAASLGLGGITAAVLKRIPAKGVIYKTLGIAILTLLMGVAWLKVQRNYAYFGKKNFDSQVIRAENIANTLDHSVRCAAIANDSRFISYYGRMACYSWPRAFALSDPDDWESAGRRLKRLSQITEPEYFVVSDFQELEKQAGLQKILAANYALDQESQDFKIYRRIPQEGKAQL